MYRVDLIVERRGERLELECFDAGLDLGDGSEAGYDAAIVPAIARPSERELQWLEAVLGRELHVLRGRRERVG